MQRRYVVAATVLGSVMFAGSAFAQSTDNAQTNNNAQNPPATTTSPTTRGAQGGGPSRNVAQPRTAADCPEGCVPARAPLTAAQRRARDEAVRAARERREQAERDRQAQLDQAQRSASDAQNAASQAQQSLDAQRAALEQARRDQAAAAQALANERAERERLAGELAERQRLEALRLQRRAIIARGGGPVHYRPLFTLGIEGGVGGFTGEQVTHSAYAGGVWGARVGVDFFNWLGVEGRYFGMANALNQPVAGTGNVITNGGSGVLRLTAPIPWVQPYVFGGVGGYHTQVNSSQQTSFRTVSYVVIPLGLGLNVPIGRFFSVGAEGTYHAIPITEVVRNTALENSQIFTGTALIRLRL